MKWKNKIVVLWFVLLSSSVFAVDGIRKMEAIGLGAIEKLKELLPFGDDVATEDKTFSTPFEKGNQLFIENKYEKANKIFQSDFSDVKNIFGAATTDRFLGRHDLAIQEYGETLAKLPNFGEAYLGRGLSYRDSGRYEEAVSDFKKYIDLLQKESGYIALGDTYMAMGRYSEAQSILSQGVAKYPTSNIMRKMLSQAYLQTK